MLKGKYSSGLRVKGLIIDVSSVSGNPMAGASRKRIAPWSRVGPLWFLLGKID